MTDFTMFSRFGILLCVWFFAGKASLSRATEVSQLPAECKNELARVIDIVDRGFQQPAIAESTITDVLLKMPELSEHETLYIRKGLEYAPLLEQNIIYKAIANEFQKKGVRSKDPNKVSGALSGFRLLPWEEQEKIVDDIYAEILKQTDANVSSDTLSNVSKAAARAGMTPESYVNFLNFWKPKLLNEPAETKAAIYIFLSQPGVIASKVAKNNPNLHQQFSARVSQGIAAFVKNLRGPEIKPSDYQVGSIVYERSEYGAHKAKILEIYKDGKVRLEYSPGNTSVIPSLGKGLAITDPALGIEYRGFKIGSKALWYSAGRYESHYDVVIRGIFPDGNFLVQIENGGNTYQVSPGNLTLASGEK